MPGTLGHDVTLANPPREKRRTGAYPSFARLIASASRRRLGRPVEAQDRVHAPGLIGRGPDEEHQACRHEECEAQADKGQDSPAPPMSGRTFTGSRCSPVGPRGPSTKADASTTGDSRRRVKRCPATPRRHQKSVPDIRLGTLQRVRLTPEIPRNRCQCATRALPRRTPAVERMMT